MIDGRPSVLYDAVALLPAMIDDLIQESTARDFVADAFAHCEFIEFGIARKTCDAINGITEERRRDHEGPEGKPALDAGLLAAAQAVEHYEMSRYGTLRTWAEELGCQTPPSFFRRRSTKRKQRTRP